MKHIVIAIAAALMLPASARSQEPNIAETKAWLESEGASFLYGVAHFAGGVTVQFNFADVALDNCVLSWTALEQTDEGKPEKTRISVPLKDVDTGGIEVRPGDEVFSDFVSVRTRKSVGPTISVKPADKPASTDSNAMMFVKADGQRVVNAVRRAALLCGAPASAF
jgi:hypothetical protein